jgi:hypothetical protein
MAVNSEREGSCGHCCPAGDKMGGPRQAVDGNGQADKTGKCARQRRGLGGAQYPPAPRYVCVCVCVCPRTVLATVSSLYSSSLWIYLLSSPLLLVRSWVQRQFIF